MKPLFAALLFTLFSSLLAAQTKMIAHKSHSGTAADFLAAAGNDDYGLPRIVIDSVVWVNDSTVLQYDNFNNKNGRTIHKHPYYNDPTISLDSLRKIYPEVRFIGFEKKKTVSNTGGEVKRNSVYVIPMPSSKPGSTGLLLLFVAAAGLLLAFFTWRSLAAKIKV